MHVRNIQDRIAALHTLDLSRIRRKLCEPAPEGKGWDEHTAATVEKWYRRFLEVCVRYPYFPAVPNEMIDAFWHHHILDTRTYARDCAIVFGRMLHHYPYFGLNGDAEQRDEAFAQTNLIYVKLFGEPCTNIPQAQASGCNHAGSGTGCGQGGRGHRFPELGRPEAMLV